MAAVQLGFRGGCWDDAPCTPLLAPIGRLASMRPLVAASQTPNCSRASPSESFAGPDALHFALAKLDSVACRDRVPRSPVVGLGVSFELRHGKAVCTVLCIKERLQAEIGEEKSTTSIN